MRSLRGPVVRRTACGHKVVGSIPGAVLWDSASALLLRKDRSRSCFAGPRPRRHAHAPLCLQRAATEPRAAPSQVARAATTSAPRRPREFLREAGRSECGSTRPASQADGKVAADRRHAAAPTRQDQVHGCSGAPGSTWPPGGLSCTGAWCRGPRRASASVSVSWAWLLGTA
jgi:hypothetical protein